MFIGPYDSGKFVNGVDDGEEWEWGLEFDYANPESVYCRAMRLADVPEPARMPVPEHARTHARISRTCLRCRAWRLLRIA